MNELLEFAGKYKLFVYVSWILAGISSLVSVIPFWYIWEILCSVMFSAGVEDVPRYGVYALAFSVCSILVYIAGLMCSHLAAFRIASNIRIKLLAHVSRLPLGVIDDKGTGRLRRIITDTSGMAETYLAHQLPDKYGALSLSLGLVVMLVWVDWRVAIVSLAPVVLGFVVMSMMTGKSMQRKLTEYHSALNAMSNEAVEYIRGIPVVKTFGQTIYTFTRFKKSIDDYEHWTTSYTNELRRPMMLFTLAVNGAFVFLTAWGVWAVFRREVSDEFVRNYVLAVILSPLITVSLMRTMRQNENEMTALDALSRVNEILSLHELPEAQESLKPEGSDVSINDVSFSYGKGRRTNTLSHITLNVKAGQVLALVGASGSGKSTLAKLIARFYDADEGTITIGGQDIRRVKNSDLMKMIAIVFQDSRLIKGSILDNVRMSRPNASREEVMNALTLAQCDEVIAKLPDGIDTLTGSEGVYLSGGETQRLAVARAILKDSPVIILDEATAFADPDNEHKMQAALRNLAADKTVIMIAHRLSTVKDADIIAVLDEGRVIETGKFTELVEKGGAFAKMWKDYQTSLTWKIKGEEQCGG